MNVAAGVETGPADVGEGSVVLRDVSFAYPGATRPALEGVSLLVRPGESVAIAGESGSGKSTLARLMAGLLLPTTGAVRTGGQDTATARRGAIAASVGLLFQNPNHQLFAPTVEAELALGPRNLRVGERATAERVADAATRLDLEAVLGAHPSRLGVATRRRVALAAVLAMRPAILVLDEPTSGQDPATVARIAALIEEETAAGTSVITVTHDLRFAAEVAGRVVILRDGRIRADGPVREVLGDAQLLADAGLEPPQVAQVAGRLGLARPDGLPLTVAELLDLLGEGRAAGTSGAGL